MDKRTALRNFRKAFNRNIDIGTDETIEHFGPSEFYNRYRSAVIAKITQMKVTRAQLINKIIRELNDENYEYILVHSTRIVKIERVLGEFEYLQNGNKNIQKQCFKNCGI